MVISKRNGVFYIYCLLLCIMIYYKIAIDYLTPDEHFYLFSESMLYDQTVAMRYKFVALFFRFLYDNGGFIALMILNFGTVWIANKITYKYVVDNKLITYLTLGFLFPSVLFYSSSFLRDFYIYVLAFSYVVFRYGASKIVFSWLILICIAFLKIEFAIIIALSVFCSKVKFNPLLLLIFVPAISIFWCVMLHEPIIMEYYIKTLLRFEPTIFEGHNNVFFGLQELDPNPVNGTLNLMLSYANLFFPFLITWPSNTGFSFNFLMTIDSLIFFTCLIFGAIGFNRKKYRTSELYRVSVIVILLSIVYGYFMVTPMTSLRMHIHFIPFLIVFITGSRFKL